MKLRTLIFILILLISPFILVELPKSCTSSYSDLFTCYYTGLGIPGMTGPILGKRYYRVILKHSYLVIRVEYDKPGYNDFKIFYPDGSLVEEGQCMVELVNEQEPMPDESDLLWSKSYKPDGSLACEVKNGTGTTMIWDPNGIKRWELKLADFKPVRSNSWYDNGQLMETTAYFNSEQDCAFTAYYRSGEKKTQGQYSGSKLTGVWIRYNEDGSIKETKDYTKTP